MDSGEGIKGFSESALIQGIYHGMLKNKVILPESKELCRRSGTQEVRT